MQLKPSLVTSLVVITFLVFLNAIHHPFVHDDVVFIVQNPHIADLGQVPDVFLHSSNVYAKSGINSYYRPVLEVFYRLEYSLFGFNADGYHLTNIIVHLFNGVLLLAILLRLKFSLPWAYAASLLFLIHPVQTEAVACVSGISNLLSSLFVLLTLYAYLREKYWLAALAFLMALLTKEQVIIVPFLLILIDWFGEKRGRGRWWMLFFGLTLIFLLARSCITESHIVKDILQAPQELRLRLLAIPRTIVMYLRLLVAPYDLHYYRNTDVLASNSGGFIILTALMGLLFGFVRKFPWTAKGVILGAGWFLICLLPVLNITPLINEYSLILTAEHFLYLPMVGIVLVIGYMLTTFVRSARVLSISIGVICLLSALMSVYQNEFWKGEVPLFERMVHFEPQFARGHILLGKAYASNNQVDQGIEHFNYALNIMSNYRQKSGNSQATLFYNGFIRDINVDLGQCYLAKGNIEKSENFFNEAILLDPSNEILIETCGISFMQTSHWEQAIKYLNRALALTPANLNVLNNMGICYIQSGDKLLAEQFFKMALGINPLFKPARDNLNRLLSAE